MSYYQGGGHRLGGDLYRPRRNGGMNSYEGNNGQRHNQNFNGGSRYQPQGDRSYRPSRYQERPHKDAYQQAYSQMQAENQLWMGDLDPQWTEASIADLWKQMGEEPTAVKIIRDKMGKLQYCFVTFPSLNAVASAISKNRAQVPGSSRFFKLNWASGSNPGGDARSNGGPGNRLSNASGSRLSKPQQEYSIFVGDLASDVSESLLYTHFDKEYPGLVKQVKIMTDPHTGANKGFGFVRFVSPEAQQAALQDNKSIVINQRKVRVGQANGGNQDASSALKKTSTEQPIPTTSNLSQQQPALSPSTDPNNSVICLHGITSSITDDDLLAHFLPFGHIIYCRLNHVSGTAHIKYLLRLASQRALVFMQGVSICGNRLTLQWGREYETTAGKMRWVPAAKNTKYVAANRPPQLYGELPYNVVFSKLSKEEVESLKFVEQSEMLSVEQLNEAQKLSQEHKSAFLDLFI